MPYICSNLPRLNIYSTNLREGWNTKILSDWTNNEVMCYHSVSLCHQITITDIVCEMSKILDEEEVNKKKQQPSKQKCWIQWLNFSWLFFFFLESLPTEDYSDIIQIISPKLFNDILYKRELFFMCPKFRYKKNNKLT